MHVCKLKFDTVHTFAFFREDFREMSAKLIAQRALAAGIQDAEQLVAFTMGFMSSKVEKLTKPVEKVVKVIENGAEVLAKTRAM